MLARQVERRQIQAAGALPFARSWACPLVPGGEEEKKGADECGRQLWKRKDGGVRSLRIPIFLVNDKVRSSSETGMEGGVEEACRRPEGRREV